MKFNTAEFYEKLPSSFWTSTKSGNINNMKYESSSFHSRVAEYCGLIGRDTVSTGS
jgi:hypothetical protein